MKITRTASKLIMRFSKSEWEKIGSDNKTIDVEAKKKKGKKGKPVNPWAICNSKLDKKENPEKFERCVLDVKEKHPVKKD